MITKKAILFFKAIYQIFIYSKLPKQSKKDKLKKNPPECRFDDRKIVWVIVNEVGIIEDNRIITGDDPTNFKNKLSPCNLPEQFKQHGLKIIFSGEIKEIYPHERWAATPFKITDIQLLE